MTTQTAHRCAGPSCDRTVERRATGRHRKFCSDRCRMRSARDRLSRYETTQAPSPVPDDFNAPADLYSKNGRFVTSKISDLQTPQKRRSDFERWSDGLIAPQSVIRAEVINGRKWDEIVSSSGVVSYVSRITKRAL